MRHRQRTKLYFSRSQEYVHGTVQIVSSRHAVELSTYEVNLCSDKLGNHSARSHEPLGQSLDRHRDTMEREQSPNPARSRTKHRSDVHERNFFGITRPVESTAPHFSKAPVKRTSGRKRPKFNDIRMKSNITYAATAASLQLARWRPTSQSCDCIKPWRSFGVPARLPSLCHVIRKLP